MRRGPGKLCVFTISNYFDTCLSRDVGFSWKNVRKPGEILKISLKNR